MHFRTSNGYCNLCNLAQLLEFLLKQRYAGQNGSEQLELDWHMLCCFGSNSVDEVGLEM
jgi:hypothetical protein